MSKDIKNTKKKIIIIISLIIFIVGIPLIAFFVKKGSQKNVEAYVVSNNTESATIINGTVYAESTHNIFLDVSKGNDYDVKIKQGDSVKKGDIVLVYNSEVIDNKISLEESQIKENKNQVQNLKEKLEKVNTKKNNISSQNVANSQANGIPADNSMNLNVLENEKEALKEKINLLTNTIKNSEIQLKELKNQKSSFTVKSPIDGNVSVVNKQNNPSAPIISIESNNKTIKGQLTEYELPNVQTVTKAFINFKALDEKYYKSRIINISKNPLNDSGNAMNSTFSNSPKVSNYEIIFEIPKEFKGKVQNGFHALIKLGEENNTMKLPKKAVYKDIDKDNKMVWTIKDNKVASKKVQVKDSGDEYIILSGINNGTKVVLDAPSNLKEGDGVTLK